MLSEKWANARRTFPQLRRNELGERVCRMWGAVRRIFGAIFHDFGASGADLGAMFGSFWGRLEVIWRFRGPNGWRAASWGALGALWGPSGDRIGAILDHSWVPIGAIMGHLGAVRGRLGAISGPSWAVLGRSWTVLGLPWGSWSDFGNHRGGMRTNRHNHIKTIGALGALLEAS